MLVLKILTSLGLALASMGGPSNLPTPPAEPSILTPGIVEEAGTSISENNPSEIESAPEEIKEDTIETKQESEKEDIPFQSKRENDSTLLKGETKLKQSGKVGVREKIYTITYTNGNETKRELSSNAIVEAPVDEVTSVGTKSPVITPSKNTGSGYINVDGDFVKSPGSDPAGASAKCKDGTYSYSKNRRGTCSGHGGVATWL